MNRRRFLGGLSVLILTGPAWARDRYIEVAEFKGAHSGETLVVNLEIRADGTRRGHLRVNHHPHGVSTWFSLAEWQVFRQKAGEGMSQARKLATGSTARVAEVRLSGGSTVKIEAVRPLRKPGLRITHISSPGDSYPPVPFELEVGDFSPFQAALAKVAAAFQA